MPRPNFLPESGSRGIFSPTASNGLSFRFRKTEKPKQRRPGIKQQAAREKMARIAEAYAEGATGARNVAATTGIPERTVERLWRQIKAEMGAQAV